MKPPRSTMRQFITFRIHANLVGIDILKVREINRVLEITPVQQAPAYVRGLLNLRGQTVTVFDLAARIGLGPQAIGSDTHNIILKQEPVGLLVDDIGDVVRAGPETIETPPANIDGMSREYMECVVKLDGALLVVLSADKLLEIKDAPE